MIVQYCIYMFVLIIDLIIKFLSIITFGGRNIECQW